MPVRWSFRSKVSLAFLAVFCVAITGAMFSYPGGSWLHPHSVSFSLRENFWCDLLREPAHNGARNGRSVALASLAFVALASALWPYWVEVSQLLPERRARLVRALGSVSAAATGLVAVLPSDHFPAAHAPAVLTAGGLGFVCGCVCGGWALSHFRRVPGFALATLWLLAAASVNLVLYVWVSYFHGPENVVLPTAQKLATIGLVCWMLAGLAAVHGADASAGRPTP